MFTRHLIMNFKASSADEFTRIVESEILPQLRRQKGCRHEDTFITPALSEAVINSYWDTPEYAAAYDRTSYLEGLKSLAGVMDRAPQLETYEISSSTFHRLTAHRRDAYRTAQLGRG
jgi:hypothetical protein